MTEFTFTVSVPLVAAVLAAEVVSFLYYSLVHRHELGDRYVVTGLVCDVIMAFLLQHITGNYWRVGKWEDAAILAAWLTLFFACLTAPHAVYRLDGRATRVFFVNAFHKFAMLFAMAMAMLIAKTY